jgi:hypothetical protein
MAPKLVASRTALPPEGAHFPLGRPGGDTLALTLVASRTALPPEGLVLLGAALLRPFCCAFYLPFRGTFICM